MTDRQKEAMREISRLEREARKIAKTDRARAEALREQSRAMRAEFDLFERTGISFEELD